MNIPDDRRYTKQHEWVKIQDNVITVGITEYAQQQLGDVVFLELPDVGDEYQSGDAFGVVESVKAASDIYVPIGGEIIERNDTLADQPELINQDCYGEAWIIKIQCSNLDEFENLLTHDAYCSHVSEVAA